MIRLIIVLLFVAIKLAMRCEENVSMTEGKLKQVLYEVDSKFNGKVGFKWKTCGKSVPTSKYLPIRAGTNTGNTRFEVIELNKHEAISGKDISKYKIQNYRMLFYVYVTGQRTVFKFTVIVTYTKKIYMQLNRNKIKSINMSKNACVTKFKNGCKFRIKNVWNNNNSKQINLTISMLNGWNQIGFLNIVWKIYYYIYIIRI